MQPPALLRYSNGQTTLSHSMRYCIEYELWAAKGLISPAVLLATLGQKYGSRYSKSNLVSRLTELMGQGKAARVVRGLYVHAEHKERVLAEAFTPPAERAPTIEDMLS